MRRGFRPPERVAVDHTFVCASLARNEPMRVAYSVRRSAAVVLSSASRASVKKPDYRGGKRCKRSIEGRSETGSGLRSFKRWCMARITADRMYNPARGRQPVRSHFRHRPALAANNRHNERRTAERPSVFAAIWTVRGPICMSLRQRELGRFPTGRGTTEISGARRAIINLAVHLS